MNDREGILGARDAHPYLPNPVRQGGVFSGESRERIG